MATSLSNLLGGVYTGYTGSAGGGASPASPSAIGTVFGYTTGNGNTAIGCCAGNTIMSGANNIAIGCNSLVSNTTGVSNIAVGAWAFTSNTVGQFNIGIGSCAGCSITTGANNTIIGTLPGAPGCICTVLIGAGTCERIKVDNSGLYVNGTPVSGGSGITLGLSIATAKGYNLP